MADNDVPALAARINKLLADAPGEDNDAYAKANPGPSRDSRPLSEPELSQAIAKLPPPGALARIPMKGTPPWPSE